MNKDTIELIRILKFVKGYGLFQTPPEITETAQLNKIVEWSFSQPNKLNIYKHVLRREEENDNGEVYKYFTYGREISEEEYETFMKDETLIKFHRPYACYYCDLVYYLDIYWQ